jgi:hypothetical protein
MREQTVRTRWFKSATTGGRRGGGFTRRDADRAFGMRGLRPEFLRANFDVHHLEITPRQTYDHSSASVESKPIPWCSMRYGAR